MKITTINSIEISSLCNNSCEYCLAPIQKKYRKVGLMEWDVFEKSIYWIKHFQKQYTQRELNLFGVGEPTLHPKLIEIVAYARNQLGSGQNIHLNTNGNTLTLDQAHELKQAGITSIDVTGHNAKMAARAIRILREACIPGNFSMDFIIAPNNWANQVRWFSPDKTLPVYRNNPCPWLARGQVMIMSDGNITNCCIDGLAKGVFTNVFDDITQFEVKEMPLCKDCHHVIPRDDLWRQKTSRIYVTDRI